VRNLVIYYKRRTRRKGLVFADGPEMGELVETAPLDASEQERPDDQNSPETSET
jgi:hypothetical protein